MPGSSYFLDYKIADAIVYRGELHDCARLAVFKSLLPETTGNKPASQLLKVVAMWRKRLQAFRSAGWLPATVDLNFTYLMNCPPFSAKLSMYGRCCHRARVCPLCYARRVVMPVYSAIEHAIFSSGSTSSAFGLVVTTSSADLLLSKCSVEQALFEQRDFCGWDAKQIKTARGVISLVDVSPARGVAGSITVRRSTFCLVSGKFDVEAAQLRLGSVRMKMLPAADVSKSAMAELIAWAAYYPAGMMFGDAATAITIDAVARKHKLRMLCSRGLLRNAGDRAQVLSNVKQEQISEVNN